MPETVMRPTSADAHAFVAAVEHARRRADAEALLELFASVTGEPPVLWGPSIVGYGSYHYRYASGREGDADVLRRLVREGYEHARSVLGAPAPDDRSRGDLRAAPPT
ncbi:hypothetical protein [Zhihengliuella sp.]|uniref:hypothetical protein n=1 Tax=Zhihengliuella sp. TaxID=1954483 RepID=UPI0028112B4E|nr:hypothetical protein [Zhihengliuella sp.]